MHADIARAATWRPRLVRIALLVLSATCAAPAVMADAPTDTAQQGIKAYLGASKQRSALPALDTLERLSATAGQDAQRPTGEFTAMASAELGDYESALGQIPYAIVKARSDGQLPDTSMQPTDAAQYITRLARDRRVVIINEAHHVPQTRALIMDLLPRLRAIGFTDYAAETLLPDASRAIAQRGYALRGDDTVYSREPVFGQLLRQAVSLGFRIDSYETSGGDSETVQQRETGEAEQLARLLRERPRARFIVHVGYGHLIETGTSDRRPMAAELKRLTRIDPLTIDQTMFLPDRPRAREMEGYRGLLARMSAGQLTGMVFVGRDGTAWSYEPARYDISVVLPDPPAKDGRPGWLWQPVLQRHPVLADPALCDGVFPCAIAARWADAPDDAVAADMVLLRGAGTRASLAVPSGHFTLVATDAQDRVLGRRDVTQTAP